jgi:Tol biopolymer transport system component
MLVVLAVFEVASIALLTACVGGGTEAGAEHGGAIAFTVNNDGFGEIWLMDSDGGNRIRLTSPGPPGTDASGSTSPAWSPDGDHIAFARSGEGVVEDQRLLEIYVMRADGSESRRLTNDRALDGAPAWAPDGQRIAFAHGTGVGTGNADGVIVVVDVDGHGRAQVTRHLRTRDVVLDSYPTWSPDGSRIAFTRVTLTPSGLAQAAIYTVDPTGGTERLLLDDAAEPDWSPDGTRIVFTSVRDHNGETCFHECGTSGEIYVANADGTEIRRLTRSEANDHSPAFAPDGERIAFVSDRSNRGGHENEIYVIGLSGGELQRLTANDVWDLEPDWRQ